MVLFASVFIYTKPSLLVAEEAGPGFGPESEWWGGPDLQVEGNTPGTSVPPSPGIYAPARSLSLETTRKSFA